MIPNMDEAAKQGWNVFFWGFDQRVSPGIKEFVYLVVFVAQLLCGLATVTSASRMIFAFARDGGLPGSKALSKVSPEISHAGRGDLDRRGTLGPLRLGHLAGLDRRHLGLHHRGVVHGHLPVPLLYGPDHARPARLGNAEVGQDGTVEPRPGRVSRLFAILSIISMVLIFVIGIQPPNDWALYITVGFFILTAIVWFAFENRRFQGPPIGELIAERQALILRGGEGRRRDLTLAKIA